MKPKATMNFELNGVFYETGDEVEVENKDQLIKLNEKGFIEPLTPKQIQNYKKEKLSEGGIIDAREDTRRYKEDR